MALKDRIRSKRSKRFGNVADNFDSKSDEMYFSSSDSEAGEPLKQNKVREGFSIRELMEKSENFKIDDDHIYSLGKSHKSCYVDVYKNRKTGRGKKRKISEESDEKPEKQRSSSKNAMMARLNRERKKMYISSLEAENNKLRTQNDEFSKKIEIQDKKICEMRQEIIYLKGLLANSKELSQILRNLKSVTGLPVTSSIVSTVEKEIQNTEDCTVDKNVDLLEEYPLRVKSENDRDDFPFLDKDINLGSCSDRSLLHSELETFDFNFDNDLYDNIKTSFSSDTLSDPSSSFHFTNSELCFENSLRLEKSIDDTSPEVGICLHVNPKRISVEICSICSSKANLSTRSYM